jgi:hypothetical protein
LVRGRTSFPQGSSCPVVLTHHLRAMRVSSTGLSPSVATRSSNVRLRSWLVTRWQPSYAARMAVQPPSTIGYEPTEVDRFGLFPVRSPLLRECISCPRPTEMFQFGRCPPPGLWIQPGVPPLTGWRVAPFGDHRITAWLLAPRCFSQLPTSFVGTRRQGIHRMPMLPSSSVPRHAKHPALSAISRQPSAVREQLPHSVLGVLDRSARTGTTRRAARPSPDRAHPDPMPGCRHHGHESLGLVVSSLQLLRCKTRLRGGDGFGAPPSRGDLVVYHLVSRWTRAGPVAAHPAGRQ